MKTSDKELDALFHSKLNELKVEPDEMVWNNIADQLQNKPKKKSIIPVLRIAASLIVVFSVGLLLLRQNQEVVKKPLLHKVVKIEAKHIQPELKSEKVLAEKKDMLLLVTKNKVVKEARIFKSNRKVIAAKPSINLKTEMEYASTQNQTENSTTQKQDLDLPQTNKIAIVPDAATSLKVQPDAETSAIIPVKPQILPAKRSIAATVVKRKGIRNMGDLVNLVMAKVDKRKDKLIEFTDSDDGEESNVTGINLGFISLKKEK